MMLEPMGLAAGPVVPTREWRELYAALDCAAVAAIHPFYTASVREFEAAGRADRGLGPGRATTAPKPGCRPSATPPTCRRRKIDAAKNKWLPAIKGALAAHADQGPHHASAATKAPSCWSRRLLIESGADVPLRRHRLPDARPGATPDLRMAAGRAACTCSTAPRSSRTSPRCASSSPTWPSAPRRWCRRPSRRAIPALYFTNLISARPLMGPAGAGSLAQVINAAIANKARFDADARVLRRRRRRRPGRRVGRACRRSAPSSAPTRSRQVIKMMKKRKAEEMI